MELFISLHGFLLLIAAVLATIYLYYNICKRPEQKAVTKIPGLQPSHPVKGNFDELIKCGSLHEFLSIAHCQYGPITSFWYGKQFMVSIASHKLFKEASNMNLRPPILFDQFKPLFGHESIQYCNTDELLTRHKSYQHVYSDTENVKYFKQINQLTDDFVLDWGAIPPDQHVSLKEQLFRQSTRNMFACSFATRIDDETNDKMQASYDVMFAVMDNMENLTKDHLDVNEEREMKNRRDFFAKAMTDILEARKCTVAGDDYRLVDAVLQLGLSDSKALDDIVTMAMGGTHTVAFCMIWSLYFLACNQKMQDKAYREIQNVLGEDEKGEKVTADNIGELVYMRQVIRESLRLMSPAPYAARYCDGDCTLGGYHIPARTPIVQALGVALHDPSIYPEPSKFQPDRFDQQNMRKIPAFGFEPFGFAGKRRCPGWKFAYVEATIVLVGILKKFRVSVVPGQKIKATYGLTSKPDDKIWVTIDKRLD